MTVSLVLATYNGEKNILSQLESIRDQTQVLDEVLIFDDNSNDNTVSIVTDFIRNNNLLHWKLTVNQRNKGWRCNFMDALRITIGDIVFLADQDDIWASEKVELMNKAMIENPNIQLLACNYLSFHDNNIPNYKDKKEGILRRIKMYPCIFNVLYPGCTYCVRKELIDFVSKYWTPDTAHDELLWRTALFNDALYVYSKQLVYWRRHRDSAWAIEGGNNKSLQTRIQWTAFALRQIDTLKSFLKENGTMTIEKDKVLVANSEWIALRRELFVYKKIKTVFELLPYLKYYNSFKQYLGDLYLTFIKG